MSWTAADAQTPSADESQPAVNRIGPDRSMVRRWLVVGPFPNAQLPADQVEGDIDRAGYTHDFLAALGGEGHAELTEGQTIDHDAGTATVQAVRAARNGELDLRRFYQPSDFQLAYAACTIESETEQTLTAYFGSDDRAIVWVNGEIVHRYDGPNRGITPGEETFPVTLRAGANRVMLKVENGRGTWGFVLELLDAQTLADREAKRQRDLAVTKLQDLDITPNQWSGYLFSTNGFPNLYWSDEETARKHFGTPNVKVRWFDRDLNETTLPDAPGRYAAYVEMKTQDGRVVRRAKTFYAHPPQYRPMYTDLHLTPPPLTGTGLDPATFESHAAQMTRYMDNIMGTALTRQDTAAMMLSMLDDAEHTDAERPAWWNYQVADHEFHLKLKAKLLGIELADRLAPPTTAESPAPTLREGTEQEAGFTPGLSDKLDELCKAWAEETGIPFTFLVARRGVIVHHAAYGLLNDKPIDTHAVFDVASISKFLTATLLAQFLEQGLVDLDEPIGKYLPDLPTEGDKMMTIRQCMNHTAGTNGHGNWRGFDNPWFESIVANGLANYEPRTRYEYNGLSLNLAARCMEVAAGKSFHRLLYEHLFVPLGMYDTTAYDSSFGDRSSAHDLALIAQLYLNGGAYGDRRYFSPQMIEKLLPVEMGTLLPDLENPDVVYGIGSQWFSYPWRKDVDADAPPEARSLLGYRTLGHGSASNSVLRIGLDNDLIITMARPEGGPKYGDYLDPILEVIAEHLAD